MYFTNKMQNDILRKIKKGNYDLYAIKLRIAENFNEIKPSNVG